MPVKPETPSRELKDDQLTGWLFRLWAFLVPVESSNIRLSTSAVTASRSLTVGDAGNFYTNEGATGLINFSLPSAAKGLWFGFICQDADGIKATAATGDTITIGQNVSASAGNVQSTTQVSVVILLAINATEWIAISATGVWTVT